MGERYALGSSPSLSWIPHGSPAVSIIPQSQSTPEAGELAFHPPALVSHWSRANLPKVSSRVAQHSASGSTQGSLLLQARSRAHRARGWIQETGRRTEGIFVWHCQCLLHHSFGLDRILTSSTIPFVSSRAPYPDI